MSHIWFKYKKISSRLNCYQWETCLSLRNIYKETYCISRIFLATKGNWTRWSYKLNWTWILYIISVIIYWINVPTDQLTCSNCKAIPLKRGIKGPSFGMISIRMISMGTVENVSYYTVVLSYGFLNNRNIYKLLTTS